MTSIRLALLLLLALLVRAPRLDFPRQPYFDEVYYIPAARDYLEGRPDANNVHPPLAKLQIAAGMLLLDGLKAYGLNPLPDQVAWRLASLLAGMGTLVATYLLALWLTGSPRTGLLSVFLLAFDFLQVVESRVATLDMALTFWTTAGLAACAHAFTRPADASAKPRTPTVWFAGLCFGAATACKWSGLFVPLGLLLWLAWDRRRLPVQVAAIFAASIVAVYLASYTPVFLRQGVTPAAFRQIGGYHARMWNFHYDPVQFRHRYLSQFYQWPLVLRPVWLYFEKPEWRVEGVVAMGCPVFWWFAALLLLDQVRKLRRAEDRVGRFLLLTYLAGWLLWALSSTGGFFYYILPVTPVMAVLVGRELADWWEEPLTRALAGLFLTVNVVLFLVYYPLLTARSVSYAYYHALFFVPSWY